jgi:hypothetical protein
MPASAGITPEPKCCLSAKANARVSGRYAKAKKLTIITVSPRKTIIR